MYVASEELTVILITIWWLQNLLAVSKQATQNFEWACFDLMKLNELEVRKKYHIEITNRFAALGNLGDD